MKGEFWLNISSKNLSKAKEFFHHLGFKVNDQHQGPHMVSLFVGNKNIVLNLFEEKLFQTFTQNTVTETNLSNEIIFSIGADSPGEVDTMAQKAVEAGGKLYGKPGYKDGWMYGCGFTDLDGHRWNILFMDIPKMPKN